MPAAPDSAPNGSRTAPLAGIVVLDLADECLALTGRLLADLGATVLRVESLAGDDLRRRGPFVDGEESLETSLAHLRYNGGKLSIAADLASGAAWDLVEELTNSVDLVIAPLEKPRVATTFFEPGRFSAAHPSTGLVDVVFRRADPGARASDLVAVASGGLLYCNGFPDRAPDYPAGKLAYKQAAINAAAAGTALLLGKCRFGGGGIATVSLEEATMSTLIQAANQNLWKWYGAVGKRAGMTGLTYPVLGKDGGVALLPGSSSTFETKDAKWVVFGMTPFTLQRWMSFVDWLEQLTGDTSLRGKEWHDAEYRTEHRQQVGSAMKSLCRCLDRDELAMNGQARGLMVVPVNTVADIGNDEHLKVRGVFPETSHPGVDRPVPAIRPPFRSTKWEPGPGTAPRLGEHTKAALRLAGVSETEIQRLASLGVIAQHIAQGSVEVPRSSAAKEPPANSEIPLPLTGYRVVDFCWQAAGPLTTEVLANLGADVIKIESMKRIDTVRLFMHPMEHFSIDTGAFFNDCNTGKRSITVNLGAPEGIEIARKLVAEADIVSSNFTPGQMEDWGFGYDDLRKLKDDIIVLTLPVMGESGPKTGWRGIGNSVVAMSGLAWHTGFADRPPAGLGPLQTDFTVPLFGAMSLIAALLERESSGQGQHIEIAQYESGLQLLDTQLLDCIINGVVASRYGNRSSETVPHGVYECLGDDRWVAIETPTLLEWQALCEVMCRRDLSARAELNSPAGRRTAEDEIDEAIASWTQGRSPEQAERELRAAGVLAAGLRHVGDLVENNEGLQEFFTTGKHPAGISLMVQNQPFTWNGRRFTVSRGPLLGEHNEEILRGELGINEETFVNLMVNEVVI